MSNSNCKTCRFRTRYDRNPASLLGRLWRWHIKWCPGWKQYYGSLPEKERAELARRYNLPAG